MNNPNTDDGLWIYQVTKERELQVLDGSLMQIKTSERRH